MAKIKIKRERVKFASDNVAGACPEVLDAILKANGLAEFADINRVAIYSLDEKSPLKSSVLKYVSIDLDYINGNSKKPKTLNVIKPFCSSSFHKNHFSQSYHIFSTSSPNKV